MIYMDNASTTVVDKEAFDIAKKYLFENYANPSSSYSMANDVKADMEDAREMIADILGARYNEIYFTSGGSESNNWAILKACELTENRGKHIISSKIEHHSVLHTLSYLEKKGYEVTYLSTDEKGIIDINELKSAIREDTVLISIMFANNEIGTIEPIKEIGKLAHEHNILFHTDAVQAVGHLPIDVNELNIDLLSASGHKFHSPKGVGFLYIRSGIKLTSLIHGGSQERNRRAGTENTFGIVAMANAMKNCYEHLKEDNIQMQTLRDELLSLILKNIEGSHLNGCMHNRLNNNINIYFENINGELLLILLNQNGVCASLGSACTTGSIDPSHVIMAISNDKKRASSSLRLTLSKYTTKDEVNTTFEVLKKCINQLRK
ncbi:cysteine desulfurase [Lachnoanaerobaculum orale]|uniref:cysteine desulfurase n=1 Tax=Lachnoanaerobaculum orale TaxID=979627 RepID=A0A3P3Q528_9FIRM|nr:cysteine desulfurase family protein [Lachnoanaerobaculum orale]RRJ16154.1 cysteine desulfurase [Lachnoanaerobaculum orale]